MDFSHLKKAYLKKHPYQSEQTLYWEIFSLLYLAVRQPFSLAPHFLNCITSLFLAMHCIMPQVSCWGQKVLLSNPTDSDFSKDCKDDACVFPGQTEIKTVVASCIEYRHQLHLQD